MVAHLLDVDTHVATAVEVHAFSGVFAGPLVVAVVALKQARGDEHVAIHVIICYDQAGWEGSDPFFTEPACLEGHSRNQCVSSAD